MKIKLINKEGEKDISDLITSITWSGDKNSVARKLEIGVAVSGSDFYLPKIYIGLGNTLKLLTDDNKELFNGYVFFKEKSHQGSEMNVIAYDGLIYLTKSQGSYNFKNITAEDITKKICSDFKVPIENVAATSIKQSFIAMGKSFYEIIMIAYTNVSKQNGKKYIPIMQKGKLNIIEKGSKVVEYELDSDINLIDSVYSESIEEMINKILITDEKGNKIGEVSNSEWMGNYGTIQAAYQREKGKNANTVAKNILKGVQRNAGATSIGNTDCITGYAIKVKEAYTGMTGLFFIDSDTHTWKDGQYQMNLGLSFENIMDKKEA